MYNRILIANRGEIALRVIRACKELGIETVAIFSEGDRGSRYLELADEAFCVGGPKSADSYLKIDQIISAAEVGNVEAVHPGYGFLAENAHFNEVCRDCNIDFIGPTPEAMLLLGDKNQARILARKAKVPIVPGSEGLIEDEVSALQLAHEIGFPVLIKATAGGGGRGMRVAANDLVLKSALQQAANEALAAFGNGGVYIEKYIEHPRHVEVQMLADAHGTAVHLWERDCSTQRRHQKLIEESPSPSIPKTVRKAICDAAVRLVQNAGYTNAGTVEFIVDQDNDFYFIEVNARIQVEHPVSEMVTGIDLIQQQIRIAAGEKLHFQTKGHSVQRRGHRVPDQRRGSDEELPTLARPDQSIFVPGGLGVRFDSHVHAGYIVPPYYDSMIGKLIVHKPTRVEAINCMLRALAELRITGIKTTTDFHRQVLSHKDFAEGKIDTGWVERNLTARRLTTERWGQMLRGICRVMIRDSKQFSLTALLFGTAMVAAVVGAGVAVFEGLGRALLVVAALAVIVSAIVGGIFGFRRWCGMEISAIAAFVATLIGLCTIAGLKSFKFQPDIGLVDLLLSIWPFVTPGCASSWWLVPWECRSERAALVARRC